MASDVLVWLQRFDPVVLLVVGVFVWLFVRLAFGFAEAWLVRVAWFGFRPGGRPGRGFFLWRS